MTDGESKWTDANNLLGRLPHEGRVFQHVQGDVHMQEVAPFSLLHPTCWPRPPSVLSLGPALFTDGSPGR